MDKDFKEAIVFLLAMIVFLGLFLAFITHQNNGQISSEGKVIRLERFSESESYFMIWKTIPSHVSNGIIFYFEVKTDPTIIRQLQNIKNTQAVITYEPIGKINNDFPLIKITNVVVKKTPDK